MGWFSSLFGGGPEVLPTPVVSVADFERVVLQSDRPVLVDVWSPGCAPCKRLEPILVQVATRYAGRVDVVQLSAATAERSLLARLGVQATPTILIYEHGEEFGRVTGFRPKAWFDEMLATEFPEVVA